MSDQWTTCPRSTPLKPNTKPSSVSVDEPANLAAGIQWYSDGSYTYDPQHPPLSRIVGELAPYLAGARTTHVRGMWDEGLSILGRGERYVRLLALTRYGDIVFFL